VGLRLERLLKNYRVYPSEAQDSGVQIKDVAELVLENLEKGRAKIGASKMGVVGAIGD
jgi:hypothetical protein